MKKIVIEKDNDYWNVYIDNRPWIKNKSLFRLAQILYKFIKNNKGIEND